MVVNFCLGGGGGRAPFRKGKTSAGEGVGRENKL